jgi:UbiD family decarboxylase
MHPLVRWQFRGGIKEKDRKAFLFEKPIDAQGKAYDIPVAIGVLAANRQIYGIGLGADPAKVNQLWAEAKANPIAPVEIPSRAAPVHEVVFQGGELQVSGQGLDAIPVPISTPGWDNAPYISAAHYITQDPDSGIPNIGTYRAMSAIAAATTSGGLTSQRVNRLASRSDCGNPSVLTNPGRTTPTATPRRRHCSRAASLRPTSPNFDVV